MGRTASQWANRITGYGEEDPEQLLANEKNYRIHPLPQQQALSGVLSEIGIVQNIIVNKRTSELWGRDQGVETLVDGHLRVSLALSAGQKSIPITYVDLSPSEEAEVLATIDPLSAMAATDAAKLGELLADVQSSDAAVQAMLAELAKQMPFGVTSTERDGQGVSSTWDQVGKTDNLKVVIGDIETRLPADVVQVLTDALNRAYEQNRTPIYETLAAIIVAGVRAVETGSD